MVRGRMFRKSLASFAIAGAIVCTLAAKADATELSCCIPQAKTEVLTILKNTYANMPGLGQALDLANAKYSIDDTRIENDDGFKIECAATLSIDTHPIQVPDRFANAYFGQIANSFRQGLEIHYTVQRTDDGRLYVKVFK